MAQLAALASSVAVVRKELDKLDEAIKQQVLSASALRKQLAAGAQQQLQLQARSCSLKAQLQEGEEEFSDLSSWAEALEKQLSAQRAAVGTSQEDVTTRRADLLKLVEDFEAASTAFEQQQGLPSLQQQLDALSVVEGQVKDDIRSEYKQVQDSIAANQGLRAEHAAAQQQLADLQQALEERKQQLAERMAEGTALLEQLQRLQTHAPAAAELAEAEGEVADLEDELVQVHCMLAVQEVEASRAQATVQQLHELVAGKKRRLNDLSNGIKAMGIHRSRVAPHPPPAAAAAAAAHGYPTGGQGHVSAYGHYPRPAYAPPPAAPAAAGTAAPPQAAAVQAPTTSRPPTVIVQEPDSEGEGASAPPGSAAAATAAGGPDPYYTATAPGTSLQLHPPPSAAAAPAAVAAAAGGRMAVQETVVCHMYAGRDGAPAAVVQQKIKVTEVHQQLRSPSGTSYQPSRQVMVEHEQRIQGMPPAGSRPLGPPHQALLGTWPHNSSTSSGSTYEHKATPALPGCGASAGGGTVPRTGQLPWAQAPAAAAGGGRGSMSGAGAAGSLISSRAYPSGVPAAAPGPAELFTTAGALLQQGQDRQQQAVPTGPPMHGNNLSYTTSGTGAHNSTGGWPHPNWSSHTAAGAYGGPNGSSSTAGYGRLSGGQRHSYQQQQQQQQQQGWAAPAQQQQAANPSGSWCTPAGTYQQQQQQQGAAAPGQGAAAAMYGVVASRRASGGGASNQYHHQQVSTAATGAPAWQAQGADAAAHAHPAAGMAPGAAARGPAAQGHQMQYQHHQHQPQQQPQQQQQQGQRAKQGSSASVGGKKAGGTKQRRLKPPPAEVDTLQHDQGPDVRAAVGPGGAPVAAAAAAAGGRKKARAAGGAGTAGGSTAPARGGRGGGLLLQEEDNPFA